MKLCFFFAFFFLLQTAESEPRTLGVSLPLSGNGANWGADVRNSLIFANEKLGDGSIKFVFEDDRCEPKGAVSVANKLTAIDKVKDVFVMCGQSVIAAAPIYRRTGTTVITMGTPSKLSELGVFRMSMSDAIGAGLLAKYIKEHHSSVTSISEDSSYPTEFLKDFSLAAKSIGLELHSEFYQSQQYDYRSLLLRVKRSKAEAIFLNTQSEQSLTAFIKQLRELGMAPQLYGAYIPGSAGFLKSVGNTADGLKFVDFPGAPELLNDQGKILYEEYQTNFGSISGWTFTFPSVFEVYRLVRDAHVDEKPLHDFLRSKTFEGIFGRYSFDKRGDLVGPKQVMRIIKNGNGALLTVAQPAVLH